MIAQQEQAVAGTPSTPHAERIDSVDVIRGVALWGILLMNILSLGMHWSAGDNPTVMGGDKGINLWTWFVINVGFEGKMRAMFSMLFGASLMLMSTRAEARGTAAGFADVWLRRSMWLILFGVVHAYFLWDGDILFHYGVAGLLLYPFRRLAPSRLLLIGVLVLATQIPRIWHEHNETRVLKAESEIAKEIEKTKLPLTEELKKAGERWVERLKDYAPSKEELEKRVLKMRRGYWEIFQQRVEWVVSNQANGFYAWALWDVAGMMLLGMGLLGCGVLSAERSSGLYVAMMAAGYGLGIPIRWWAASYLMARKFDILAHGPLDFTYDLTRVLIAAGHIGFVMLLCRKNWIGWLRSRVAAVGRMALTNYLSHTLIATTLFYGYGFGWYGRLERHQLYYVVAGIWLFQLVVSPLWLKYFLYGPAEWLWRSLTLWQRHPMRRVSSPLVH